MNYLFAYLDIFLLLVVSLILLYEIFFKKSFVNSFIDVLVCNLILLIVAFSVLSEQLQIGQFIVVDTIFLLVIITAYFYMERSAQMAVMAETMRKIRVRSYLTLFVFLFLISSVAFFRLVKKPVVNSTKVFAQSLLQDKDDFYKMRIEKLNSNKIFQNLTEIIIIYSGISVALLFFTKKRKGQ